MIRTATLVPGFDLGISGPSSTETGILGPFRATATSVDTTTNRVLSWLIGLLLGVLTVKTEYVGTPTDFFSRVAPVDFPCLALLIVLFFHHRMKLPPLQAFVYVAAIVISLIPGLLITSGEERPVWTGASALFMAFGYYLIGLNVGSSRYLLRGLLGGLCVGVFLESIIVIHDVIVPNQWFPDPMDGRVRGTFKANGQLGAYGFCAAGLLMTFGSTLGTSRFRKVCVMLAISAASFVFLASRRTGMISVIAWGVLFTALAWRFSDRAFYKVFVGTFLALLIGAAAMWTQIESSFVGRRFMNAVSSMGKDEGFIQNQFKSVVHTSDQWFPFGFGVGRGSHINPADGHEVHNNLLALLVELGVLGALGFVGMILIPLYKRKWHRRSREHELLGVLLTSFMLISLLFMCHNTLARDRTFLLYLGIATIVAAQESRPGVPSIYFPGAGAGEPAKDLVPRGIFQGPKPSRSAGR